MILNDENRLVAKAREKYQSLLLHSELDRHNVNIEMIPFKWSLSRESPISLHDHIEERESLNEVTITLDAVQEEVAAPPVQPMRHVETSETLYPSGYKSLYNALLWPVSPFVTSMSPTIETKGIHPIGRNRKSNVLEAIDNMSDLSSRMSSFDDLQKLKYRNSSILLTPPAKKNPHMHPSNNSTIPNDFSLEKVYRRRNPDSIHRSHRKLVSRIMAEKYANVIKVNTLYCLIVLVLSIISFGCVGICRES